MSAQMFARVFGVIFLLAGLLGFFVDSLWGLVHFDFAHNVIHLVFGIAGLYAAGQLDLSVLYTKIVGVVYLLAGVLGLIFPDMFGLMHLELLENIGHLIVGAIAVYFATQNKQ